MSTVVALGEGLWLGQHQGVTTISNGKATLDLSEKQVEVLARSLQGYLPFDLAERKREIARYETLMAGGFVCGGCQ